MRPPLFAFALAAALATLPACAPLPKPPQPVDQRPVAMADPGSALQPGWQHGAFMVIDVRNWRDSNGDGIGDLRGLTQSLDALADLGIKGLRLMPITRREDAGPGQAVSRQRSIEPAYGTLADFDQLLDEAHRRGIGVIMDYTMTPGAAAPPAVLAYHQDSLRFWLNRGLDGFHVGVLTQRLENDATPLNEPPESPALMRDVQQLISSYRQRYLVCEATPSTSAWALGCESTLALDLSQPLLDAARGRPEAIARVAEYLKAAPTTTTTTTMLPKHDALAGRRPGDEARSDAAAYRLAAATTLLLPGTPFIDAGNALGMPGKMAAAQPDPQPLPAFYKPLLALRNTLGPIARGSSLSPQVEGLVFAFQRQLADDRVLVLINYGREAATLRVAGLPAGATLSNEYPAGGALSRTDERGAIHLALAPQSWRVLRLQR
ncbi:alpha-amylase family glycosyl hydrolase [Aquabacterium sp.]|uniref:alpha-amylase family glycosyl hydrolase n=1 Tax=Aquabacterium sp. TaxID=1872578 RepID=UPI002D07A77D|nr:alpha-amylase family glycosyl hydrolase [Aquabacterium sp.]HSW07552.1 alpha-amylase family glycosyl hydrolase [Aquabacterium sp.]